MFWNSKQSFPAIGDQSRSQYLLVANCHYTSFVSRGFALDHGPYRKDLESLVEGS